MARDVLHALDFIHRSGYVHKDLHPGNVFIFQQQDRMVPQKDPAWLFKIADLGITRLEGDIDQLNTTLAGWMLPPEYLDPPQFGEMDRRVDVYHAGLLFLALLLGRTPEFSNQDIIRGEPRLLAESLHSPFAPVIANALRRHVVHRTESAISFWRGFYSVLGGIIPPL